MILAKPSGVSLKEHTENVIFQAKEWIKLRYLSIEKYKEFFGVDISNSLLKVCKYHDLGKKVKAWQQACQDDFIEFQKTSYLKGNHLRKAKIRHEIHSVLICEQNKLELSIEEKIAILSHHGKLGCMHEEKWLKWQNGIGEFLWKEIKSIDYKITNNSSFEDIVRKSFQIDFLRGSLQIADKRASTIENNILVPKRIKFKYNFNPKWELRPVQKITLDNSKRYFILLRAPTGSGKTDACLLWADQQINVHKRADKLVVAMPTRFTSNALGINVSSSLSQIGIYHSTAKFLSEEGIEGSHFASLLETPATICTIDHLLYCLSKTKEEHHVTFGNLANSCVVFDEVDFYDEFTQQNLLVLLQVLNILKVPVLLMSASIPDSSINFYRQSGYSINKIHEDSSDIQRIRCHLRGINDYTGFDDIKNLLQRATLQPTIIYINTVDRALKLGRWFMENYPQIEVEVYHSRFTEADKIYKEKRLIEMLGKEAWQNNQQKGIAILTQIGEMSVNISSDFMISEICPIDRLTQRIGRLARFHEQAGELQILKPLKNGQLYPAPYGWFDKKNKKWIPSKALIETNKNLQIKSYSAFNLNEIVNEVYKDNLISSDKSLSNAQQLRKMISQFWLILPGYELDEDNNSGHWKARDISGQVTILALTKDELNSTYFESWMELSKIIHNYGISCPTYLVKLNQKTGTIIRDSVYIKDDEVSLLFLSNAKKYSNRWGLDLAVPVENIDDLFL